MNGTKNSPVIVGFSGKRESGKSTAARMLFRFFNGSTLPTTRLSHTFDSGKELTINYLMQRGASYTEAYPYVFGTAHDKEAPNPYLPDNVSTRYFMEELGKFMGTTLGSAWTVGTVLRANAKSGIQLTILESVVYEKEYLKHNYPNQFFLVEIISDRVNNESGHHTDSFKSDVSADWIIDNSGSLEELELKVGQLYTTLMSKFFNIKP